MNLKDSYSEVLAKHNKPKDISSRLGRILDYLLESIQGFHYKKYWKRREYVINPNTGNRLLKVYYLYWIKRVDAKNHCSFGTSYNHGAFFKTPPLLPHGPSGIIVGHDAIIGANCLMFQQVTIAEGGGIIGDNVLLGAGCKILPGAHIGNNAKVGANAVVVKEVPDNATCVMQPARIIVKEKEK